MPDDGFVEAQEFYAAYHDGEFDPLPDDPGYEKFLLERARLERAARRLFRCRRPMSGGAKPSRRLVKPLHSIAKLRRFRRSQRRQRVQRVARTASSGVGNEDADSDGEPPPSSSQERHGFGHKRHEEHHVAGQLSRVPGGQVG